MPKYGVRVTVETVDDIDPADLAEHAAVAIRAWGGQYPLESDLFPTNIERVAARCRGEVSVSEKD